MPLKLVNQLVYLGSNISFILRDANMLSITWKFDLFYKIKGDF